MMRPFPMPRFVGETGPNGISIRATRWGKRPAVSIAILFPGAGNVADPAGLEGLADVVCDTIFDGTSRLSSRSLAEAMDDLALHAGLSAGYDAAIAHLSVLESDLDAGLALLAEVLTDPAFPEEEVEKSRRRHLDSLIEQRSEPDFLGRERLLSELYPGHPYGRIAATERGLAGLTRDDVVSFFHRNLSLQGATIVLAGPGPEDALVKAALRAFGSCAKSPGTATGCDPPRHPQPSPAQGLTIHLVDRREAVQTNLLFGRSAIRRRDPLFPAAIVANQSLGGGASSRLFHVLREERGLTYGAFSFLSPRRTAGHFGASIECRTDATADALSGLFDLVRTFSQEGPTKEEHLRSLGYLTGSFAIAHETPGAFVGNEVTRLLHDLPDDEWMTWRDRIGGITPEQAAQAARELFSPDVGVVTAVGDARKIRPILEAFGETTTWDADGPRP
jgi:zinc protease